MNTGERKKRNDDIMKSYQISVNSTKSWDQQPEFVTRLELGGEIVYIFLDGKKSIGDLLADKRLQQEIQDKIQSSIVSEKQSIGFASLNHRDYDDDYIGFVISKDRIPDLDLLT